MSLPPLSYLNGFSSNHDIIGDMKIEEQKNDVKDHDAWWSQKLKCGELEIRCGDGEKLEKVYIILLSD